MVKSPVRGVLFDKDGMLFDFAATWSSVIDETLAALSDDPVVRQAMAEATGYDPVSGRFQPGGLSVAGTLAEVAEVWARFLPETHAEDIYRVATAIEQRSAATGALVPVVPDLKGFLAGLRGLGYVLGIATHDSEAAARAHMAETDALDHFAFIAGYDSGHGHKPGPGMLLAFAKATGLDPAEIAMVGDSIHDLGVAPAAGAALAIGVLTGPAGHADLAPHADHVIASIADLPGLLDAHHRG